MLYIGFLISFTLSYILGFYKKRFIFLFLDVLIGLGIGILTTYLYLIVSSPKELGLGIIALVPVFFILFSFFNIVLALIGGITGTLIGKKKK